MFVEERGFFGAPISLAQTINLYVRLTGDSLTLGVDVVVCVVSLGRPGGGLVSKDSPTSQPLTDEVRCFPTDRYNQ